MKSIIQIGFLAGLCATALPMLAQSRVITETVVLQNGVSLSGYTSSQTFGDDIEFTYYNADDDEPQIATLNWNDIKYFRSKAKDPLMLGGMGVSIWTSKSKTPYKGYIKEQYVGESIVFHCDYGRDETIEDNDIIKMEMYPILSDQSIWKQAPLLDILVSDNGIEKEGIIIEKNYEHQDQYYYMILTKDNPYGTVVYRSHIKEIKSIPNPEYAPAMDIILPSDSIYLKQEDLTALHFSKIKHAFGDYLVADKKLDTIVINCKDLEDEDIFEILMTEGETPEEIYAIPVKKGTVEPSKELLKLNSFEKDANLNRQWYQIIICEQQLVPFFEPTSPTGIKRLIFEVTETGLFLLYRPSQKSAVLLEIKK